MPKAFHRPGLLFAEHAHNNREQVHNALVAHLGLLKSDKRILVVSEITGQHVDHFVRRTPWLYVVPAAHSAEALESINAHRAHMPPAMLARVSPAVVLDMTDPSAAWDGVGSGYDAVLAVVQDGGASPTGHLFAGAMSVLAPGGKLFVWVGVDAYAETMHVEETAAAQALLMEGSDAGLAAVACTPGAEGNAAMLVFQMPE